MGIIYIFFNREKIRDLLRARREVGRRRKLNNLMVTTFI